MSGLEKSRQRKCHVVHSIPSKKMTITIKSKFVVATRGDNNKKKQTKNSPPKKTNDNNKKKSEKKGKNRTLV